MCEGFGFVEGDKATLSAAKQFVADRKAAWTIMNDTLRGPKPDDMSFIDWMHFGAAVHYGFGQLEVKDPTRLLRSGSFRLPSYDPRTDRTHQLRTGR